MIGPVGGDDPVTPPDPADIEPPTEMPVISTKMTKFARNNEIAETAETTVSSSVTRMPAGAELVVGPGTRIDRSTSSPANTDGFVLPTAGAGETMPTGVTSDAGVDTTVSPGTAARIAAATAANTTRAYTRHWSAFTAWCAKTRRTALPASDATLAEYVAALADAAAGPASIEQAISTVRRVHRDRGAPPPDTRAARLVLRGHRRDLVAAGERVREAPPAAREQLRAMVAACPPGPLGIRDTALLVLGVAMMGRRSELAALDLADLTEVAEGLLVRVRMSKTDQDAAGVDVAVPYGSHPDTCPVRAVRAWTVFLTENGIVDGPLLRAVDRHGHISPRRMSGDGINRAVRQAAVRANLPGATTFTAHSLRAGGATAAARAGANVAAIARQGRWSPASPVVHRYIRAVDAWRDNPMVGAL